MTVNKNKDILRFLKREPLFVLKVKKKMCYVLRHHVNPEAEVNTWGWGTAPHRMFGGHESVSGDFSSFHVNFTKLLKNWRHGVWRLGCPVILKTF